jgi:hypothetical protein
MLKIVTKWSRTIADPVIRKPGVKITDSQTSTQHFVHVPHYREYQALMKKRGWTGETLSVTDTVTGKTGHIGENDKIVFEA